MVPKSMTLNDLERRNGPYFAVASGSHRVKVVEDVVVRKFAFAISSPDEFLVISVPLPLVARPRIFYYKRGSIRK